MMAYILVYMVLSLVAGHIGENIWANSRRHGKPGTMGDKLGACKVMYGFLGLGVIATQGTLGVFGLLAGVPICLSHLDLIRKNPSQQLTGMMIVGNMWASWKRCFRDFMDRGRFNRRR